MSAEASAVAQTAAVAGDDSYGADRARVARTGLFNLVGAGISMVSGLGLTIVVTRGVDAVVAGVFFSLTSVFLILSAAAKLGAETGVVYLLAQHRVLGATNRVRATIRVAVAPTLVASVLLAVVLWMSAPWVARTVLSTGTAAAIAGTRVFAIFVPASVIGGIFLAAARGLGTTRPAVLVDRVLRPGLQFVGMAAVLAAGRSGSVELALAWSAPFAVGAVVAGVWLLRLRRRAERRAAEPAIAATRADWTTFWRYSTPRAGTGLAQLALQRLDVVLVAALRGPVDAALYTAATRFLVIGQLGGQSLATAVQHRFSGLLVRNRHDEANRLYQMTTAWLIVLVWPFYLTWAIYGDQLMRVFGEGYAVAGPVGIVLALSMLVATACGMVSTVQEMAGHTGVAFFQTMLALAVNIAIDIALIPTYGAMGAAIGWAAAILLKNLLPLVQLQRRHQLSPLGRGSAVAMALAALFFGVIPLTGRLLLGDSALVGVALVGLATAGYAAAVWRSRRVLQLDGLRKLRRGRTAVAS